MSIILKVCLVSVVVPYSWSLLMASENYCSTRVCDPGTHVMCQYGKIKVGKACTGHAPARFNEAHKNQILNEINTKRANLVLGNEIGQGNEALPRGYAMSRVFWDDELARFAEVWVNQCIDKTDECRNTLKYRSVYQWISYTTWLDGNQNLTNKSIESSITAIFKWFWGARGHLTPSLITHCEFINIERQNEVYLNMMFHQHTAVGCGMASMIVFHTKRVYMVCNFSNRLKLGDAVYPTVKPLQSTMNCGCPEDWHETADCLCMPDEFYYLYYHLASPSRTTLTTSKSYVMSSHPVNSISDMKDSVQNIPPIKIGQSGQFIIPMKYLHYVQSVQPTTAKLVKNRQLVNAVERPQNVKYQQHPKYIQPVNQQPVRFIQAINYPPYLRDAYTKSKTFKWVPFTTQREFLSKPTSNFEFFRFNKTMQLFGAAKYKTRNFTWMATSPEYTREMFRSNQLATLDYSQNFFLPIFSLPPANFYDETTTERKLQSGEDMFLFFETKYQKPETTAVPITVKVANEEINKTIEVYSNSLIYERKIARNSRFTVYDQHNLVNKQLKKQANETAKTELNKTEVTNKNELNQPETTDTTIVEQSKTHFDIKVTTKTENADHHNIQKWNGVEDKVMSESRTAEFFKPFFDMTTPKTSTVIHTSDQMDLKFTTETGNADYHNIHKWNGIKDKVMSESRTAEFFKPFFDMTSPKTSSVIHTSDQIDVKFTTETGNADYHNIHKWKGIKDKVMPESRTAEFFKPFDMTTPKTSSVIHTSDQIDVKFTTETGNADYHNIHKWKGIKDKVMPESRTAEFFKPFDMTTPKTSSVIHTSDQIDVKLTTETGNADYHNMHIWNVIKDKVMSESHTAEFFKPFLDITTPKTNTVIRTSEHIDVKVTTEIENSDNRNIHKWSGIKDKATTKSNTADFSKTFFNMSTQKISSIVHTSDQDRMGEELITESTIPQVFKKRFEVKDVTSNSNTVGIYKTPFEVKKVATTTGDNNFGYKSNIEMREVVSTEPAVNAIFDKPLYAEDTEILIRSQNKNDNTYNQDFHIKEDITTETNFVFNAPFNANVVIRENDNLDTYNIDFDVNIEGGRRNNRAIGLLSLLETLNEQAKQAKLNSKEQKALDFARRMENVQEGIFAESHATVMPLLHIPDVEENDEVDKLMDFLKHKPNG